ncbi:MAG: PQQ-binding-like beta-propeller repeat protein [Pseudobdellovibrionaceae bacterium]
MRGFSFYCRYRSTFGIFPALIPLIEILPWVLGAIGALAGGTQAFSAYWQEKKSIKRALQITCALGLVSAAGLYVWEELRVPDSDVGSVLTKNADLPVLTQINPPYSINSRIVPLPGTAWKQKAPQQLWAKNVKEELLGTPLVQDGAVLIGTFASTLEAYNVTNGAPLWSLKKGQPIFTSPVISNGKIYIGEGLHTADMSGLTALSFPDGKPLWERKFASHLEAPPAIDDDHNRLWMGAGSLGLWALDTQDGSKIWWAKIGHIDVSPLYTEGRLFAAAKLKEETDGCSFFEIDPENGDVIEQVALEGNPMGKIMELGQGKFLVSTAVGQVGLNKTTDKGWVYMIDLNHTKKIRWSQNLSTMALPEGQILADKSLAFFTVKDGSLVAINTATGQIQWSQKLGGEFKSDLALFETPREALAIAQTTDGYVHVLDARTGNTKQKLKFESGSYAAPVVKEGVLYITTHHNIYALSIH